MGGIFSRGGNLGWMHSLDITGGKGDLFGIFEDPKEVAINDPTPAPELPEPGAEGVMPVSDDEDVKRSRRQAIARRRKSGGRASTILTNTGGGNLGG